MASTNSLLASLRPRRCLADSNRPRREKCGIPREPFSQAVIARAVTWELHIGIIQLYITGDGDNAWLACSRPDYSPGPTGTQAELAIARRAVAILNRDHRSSAAGIPEIKAALKTAAADPSTFDLSPQPSGL